MRGRSTLALGCNLNADDTLSDELRIEPIWLSSRDHLNRFHGIVSAKSWLRIMLGGRYVVPSGFPNILIDEKPFPLVYYSSGELRIGSDAAFYTAGPYEQTFMGKRRRNLDSRVRITISRRSIEMIGRFKPEAAVLCYFTINWLEIKSRDLPESALLCIGSSGPGMGRMRRGTDRLTEVLTAWANGNWSQAKDTWSA
jgi:hypothetical protein